MRVRLTTSRPVPRTSTAPGTPTARYRSGEAGFTMVELLVAMATGLVVLFAAFGLIDLATRVGAQVTDRVDATTEARSAMENLVQELNSGCVASDISPVQPSTSGITPAVSTDSTHLVFVAGLGQSKTIDQGESITPVEHVVSLKSNGSLVDTSYAYVSGQGPTLQTAPGWTFGPNPIGSHVLLTHVQAQTGLPMFQYYSFSYPSNATAQSLVGAVPFTSTDFPLNASWPPTAANSAASIAQLDIAWKVAPKDNSPDPSRAANIDDSVAFRLTPATPGGPNYPCD